MRQSKLWPSFDHRCRGPVEKLIAELAEAYLDGGWSTPDLQAFMDLVRAAGKGPGEPMTHAATPALGHEQEDEWWARQQP